MYVWSSLRPRSYLHHRTLAVAAGRLFLFWLPYITELSAFDATVSAPSSIPLVGWAVDAFMVFGGGWLLLFACARLMLQVPLYASAACTPRTEQRTWRAVFAVAPIRNVASGWSPCLPCSQPHLVDELQQPGRPGALRGPPGCPDCELPHPCHPRHLLLRQPGGASSVGFLCSAWRACTHCSV